MEPTDISDHTCKHPDHEGQHDNTYVMRGECRNCGSKLLGRFTFGHPANSYGNGAACQMCGCKDTIWIDLYTEPPIGRK